MAETAETIGVNAQEKQVSQRALMTCPYLKGISLSGS
jgi:hypothetical protein